MEPVPHSLFTADRTRTTGGFHGAAGVVGMTWATRARPELFGTSPSAVRNSPGMVTRIPRADVERSGAQRARDTPLAGGGATRRTDSRLHDENGFRRSPRACAAT
jgi:hypothetical protein